MLQNSPSKAQPSASLSLSDLEDEVGDVQHLDHQFNPPKFEVCSWYSWSDYDVI